MDAMAEIGIPAPNLEATRHDGATGRGLAAARWLVLLAFVPGIAPSLFGLQGVSDGVSWMNAVAALACALLLTKLGGPAHRTLWCWILLSVFIGGYYLKFFIFAGGLPAPYDPLDGELGWVSLHDLTLPLKWTTVGFVTFCVVATGLLSLPDPPGARIESSTDETSVERRWGVLVATAAGAIVASLLPLALGFGQMGVEHATLPFRLDAVVTRFRGLVIPASFLLLIWRSDRRRDAWIRRASMAGLMMFSFLDGVVRASRGSVLHFLLPVFFLWILSHRFTRYRAGLAALAFVSTVVLYPFFTDLRADRIRDHELTTSQIANASTSMGEQRAIAGSLGSLITRISGLDGLAQIFRHKSDESGEFAPPDSSLLLLFDNERMASKMTYEIVGISTEFVEGRPPGLVGAFILGAGEIGMVPLVALYTLLTWAAWRVLARRALAPVFQALFAWVLLLYSSEGVLGVQDPISWAVAFWAITILDRRILRKRASPRETVATGSTPFTAGEHGNVPGRLAS